MKVKVIQISIQVLFGILGLFTLFGILVYEWTIEKNVENSCPIPLSWLDKPKIIIRTIIIKEPVYIKQTKIPSINQSKHQFPGTRKALKATQIKKPPIESCETEKAACIADKYCKARGCTELKYYFQGLNFNK
jgi:hypothetical protein